MKENEEKEAGEEEKEEDIGGEGAEEEEMDPAFKFKGEIERKWEEKEEEDQF